MSEFLLRGRAHNGRGTGSWLHSTSQTLTCVRIQFEFLGPGSMQRVCDLSIGVHVRIYGGNFQDEMSRGDILMDPASVEKLKTERWT